MDLLYQFIDLFLHVDQHLTELVGKYGLWVYLILFVIVFCETGLVVTPLLPGDSLLFAAGAVAALTGVLDPGLLILLLLVAAILGDTVNYSIGKALGPRVFKFPKSWFFNPAHLQRTHRFYEKYGGKTIIIARFVPIVRTFAPFVAGLGTMRYRTFIAYNVIGAVLWVPTFILAGYYFAHNEFVKQNFSVVILAIIVISVLPMVYEFARAWLEARRAKAAAAGKAP